MLPNFKERQVSLTVKDREYVVLLGPSGCGKTSLLKSIAGIYPPDSGSVFIGGKNVTALPIEERNIGMMFQNYALFPHLTAEGNASYGPKMRELPSGKIQQIARQMLSLAKFPLERAGAKPSELSGGMQQRVALARALASQSSLLLLDEPLSALDAKIGDELRHDLRRLAKKLNLTAIHVTHNQEEAMSTADTIVVMNRGRIMQADTPEKVYFEPNCLFVADFVGEANFFEGEIVHGKKSFIVRFLGKEFGLAGADRSRLPKNAAKAVVMIRPEKMAITKKEPGHGNFVKAKIEVRRFLGEKIRYELVADGQPIVSKRLGFGKSFKKGDIVFVSFDPENAMLFNCPDEPLEKIVGRQTA
ncbi:MAG: ABC transporter ATP-binding protein [Candidatus Micrarchaeota archaeon]|nr:ABC transporter ATP-binding protein [Candidatus Micrarchaeota archaeon]